MERDEILAFTRRLEAMLLDGEDAFIVDVGAKAPTPDCDEVSTTVTIKGYVGRSLETFTGNGAFSIESSARIARMKLRDARAAHARKLEKAKAEKVPA